MIPPILVHLNQFLELCLKIIDRFIIRLFSRRIKGGICRRLGGISMVPVSLASDRLFLMVHIDHRDLLQHRILLKLLLDKGFQLESWRLQQCQRLLQLRRQHLRECHLL